MMKVIRILFNISAIAILAGAASRLFLPDLYSYIYASGAVLFAITQFILRPKHTHYTVKRLVIQQQIGALFLIGAGVLMFTHNNNEWVPVMFCGALIELYTAYRLPSEVEKHRK